MKKNGCLLSFAAVLGIVFIVLKLVGVIDWHWAFVLSPIWAAPILLFVANVVAVAMYVGKKR